MSPELDSSSPSPYDDLNRLERNIERSTDRKFGRDDRDRISADRLQERDMERVTERYERNGHVERVAEPEIAVPAKVASQAQRNGKPHPLIEGLFDKLPEAETEWSIQGRHKWLQTAGNIFDLLYSSNDGDAAEISVRVERASR